MDFLREGCVFLRRHEVHTEIEPLTSGLPPFFHKKSPADERRGFQYLAGYTSIMASSTEVSSKSRDFVLANAMTVFSRCITRSALAANASILRSIFPTLVLALWGRSALASLSTSNARKIQMQFMAF